MSSRGKRDNFDGNRLSIQMVLRQDELMYRGKVVFERLEMSKDFKRAPKIFFENEACFLILNKGSFDFRSPNQLLSFSEGEGMLAKCGNYFIENDSAANISSRETVEVIGAFFYPELLKKFFENDLSIENFQKPVTVSKVYVDAMIRHFLISLNYLFDHPSAVDENLIVNKQKELLILLSKSEKASSISGFIKALFSPYEYAFKETIEKNCYSDLTVAELAYLCKMSEASFKRKFSSIYKQSPAKYMQGKKLKLAKRLLKLQTNTIAEIAYDCGFRSPSSFNKAFQKNFGLTPTEYRKS